MKDFKFSDYDLKIITGFILYDLGHFGLLNEKGRSYIDNCEIPEDLIKEIGSNIHQAITDKIESGSVC